jgi:hypothetical protein
MTIEELTKLLGVLTWPTVVLVAIGLLRRELAGLFGRVREIEGPGNVKVSLDPNKVEAIIEAGRKQNAPPSAVAEQIVQAATVLDQREARILRALVDDDGRTIYAYRGNAYYRPALESLLAKGYVRPGGKGFALTPEGRHVTKEYLVRVLRELESSATKEHAGGPSSKVVPAKA